jgi:hypothetical protein
MEEFVFPAWTIPTGLALIGFGIAVLQIQVMGSSDEIMIAKGCFLLATIIFAVQVFVWGIATSREVGVRVVVCLSLFGALGWLSIEAFRYLDRRDSADRRGSAEANTRQAVETSIPFSAEVRSAFVSDSGPITLYMVTYPSMFGQTASPVLYLAVIQVTNLQDVVSTIDEFKVAASKELEGPWEDLVPVPLAITNLYVLGIHTPYPKVMEVGRGTYRLGTSMTKEDMRNAALLRADPALEFELTKPIQPHSTISGWVALDSLRHVGLTPGQIYFRITLRDAANKGGRYVTPLPIRQPGEPLMDVNIGSLQVVGLLTDISNFHVKYYSDPFSRPEDRK